MCSLLPHALGGVDCSIVLTRSRRKIIVSRTHFCVSLFWCDDRYHPDCSVCNNDYTGSVGFACSRCSGTATGIVVISIIILACVVVGIALALHLLSGSMESTERGLVDRIIRIVPVQAVKIIIVAWQIVTQVRPALHQSEGAFAWGL